jgi:hypothetical protein
MARDYLSIPGMSEHELFLTCVTLLRFLATTVDVKQVFSMGRLLLPYVHSRLSVQSTCALMCLGSWSLLGLVDDADRPLCG